MANLSLTPAGIVVNSGGWKGIQPKLLPVKVLILLVGTSEHLNRGVNNVKFGCCII